MQPRRVPPTYRAVTTLLSPVVRWWGRLEVRGERHLPPTGPILLMANHDSHWDPVVIAVAARECQIRALAKATLWKSRLLGWVLDGMGQIPIQRGRVDMQALDAAADVLRSGACVGVFPEGTISRGMATRAHSGAGRLALTVPEAHVVCARVTGVVDIVRVPKRPRLRVEFFPPASGQPRPGETAIGVTKRVMAEIREGAPAAIPGRRKKAEQCRRTLAEQAARALG